MMQQESASIKLPECLDDHTLDEHGLEKKQAKVALAKTSYLREFFSVKIHMNLASPE